MKILFLDDDYQRRIWFFDNIHKLGHDITMVNTAVECIEALSTDSYDLISLDHDLGGTVYAPSDEHSGHHVAKWITEKRPDIRAKILIHSWNPLGANNMVKTFNEAGIESKWQMFDTVDYWKEVKSDE